MRQSDETDTKTDSIINLCTNLLTGDEFYVKIFYKFISSFGTTLPPFKYSYDYTMKAYYFTITITDWKNLTNTMDITNNLWDKNFNIELTNDTVYVRYYLRFLYNIYLFYTGWGYHQSICEITDDYDVKGLPVTLNMVPKYTARVLWKKS